MAEHACFTVDTTAYLRNLDRDDLREETFAIHYQKPPVKNEGSTTIGLRFPTLIVAQYVEDQREIADKVARILNAHWDDEVSA
jgi:hypothetical protein